MRLTFSLLCLLAVGLAGCSEKPVLTLAEKIKFTTELIDDRADCQSYRQQLAAPLANQATIDQTYGAANLAHCLKPNV